eukprot:scaffold27519_cov98-Isochrysis_galbana.AAC.1
MSCSRHAPSAAHAHISGASLRRQGAGGGHKAAEEEDAHSPSRGGSCECAKPCEGAWPCEYV